MSTKDLEKRIAKIYRKAAKDMHKTVEDYFEKFKGRDEEMLAKLTAGEITQSYYKQWRLAQIGRGEKFVEMRDKYAERMTKANEIAAAYINNEIPKVYSYSHRHLIQSVQKATGDMLKGVDFTLLNEHTVRRLLKESPDLMPYYPKARAIQRGIDLKYGKRRITENVTQGILQGKSIKEISDDLQKSITTMNRTSAIRSARTAMNNATNAGKQAAAEELADKGVIMKKEWIAAGDARTREEHAMANGQQVDIDKPFIVGGEKLMFPGDQSLGASDWNLYNCRCTHAEVVVGFKSTLTDEQRERANIRIKIK